jgi:hypothetical protein
MRMEELLWRRLLKGSVLFERLGGIDVHIVLTLDAIH